MDYAQVGSAAGCEPTMASGLVAGVEALALES